MAFCCRRLLAAVYRFAGNVSLINLMPIAGVHGGLKGGVAFILVSQRRLPQTGVLHAQIKENIVVPGDKAVVDMAEHVDFEVIRV